MKILGIETSCDETAAAVVEDSRILSDVIASQIDIHAKYGGVVPELASREHLKKLNLITEECLANAGLGFRDIDGIAVTSNPGLEGSLLVGLTAARTLSYILKVPLAEVDHLESHLFASAFTGIGKPPGLGLVVSGGHTRLVHIREWGRYEVLGDTRDDAAGECFDKVASVLGLPYPGGPSVEKAALSGSRGAYRFPVSDLGGSYDFSYSGLKTAVLYKIKYDLQGKLDGKTVCDIAAAFQEAALKPLVDNTLRAASECGAGWIFVCGGVAASGRLRELFGERAGKNVFFPDKRLCTDNAAMVAACGEFYLQRR
ncbi:MAG: tRNA (adenosine(37)-N6)-threonylcarbamoyltransferase complex transferase subunit TsaD [Elusimicrobia bacterium]|nr:tRNA (adenosine(37)-N6)-threonylcarbamoyltransferase complex transferase subunit TsaD [Elusimicrobiota bacterium]